MHHKAERPRHIFSCVYGWITDRLTAHVGVALRVAARERQAGCSWLDSAEVPSWTKGRPPNWMDFSDTPGGIFSSGMGFPLEQSLAGLGQPPRPQRRPVHPGAVGGNAGIGVHLPVDFRHQHKGKPVAQRLQAAGPPPNRGQTIKKYPTPSACAGGFPGRTWSDGACTSSVEVPGE